MGLLTTTRYKKQVKDVWEIKSTLLKPASANKKLGGGKTSVGKGKLKGLPMYSLTLTERSTCPQDCQQWTNCYGNNMPFAHRVNHEDLPTLRSRLSSELAKLLSTHSQGVLVRLHVLGDFFSVPYVEFWQEQMEIHPKLHIFGYTHRKKDSDIGKAISVLNAYGAWIRWSDAGGEMSANVEGEGITCPEQTGKTAGCLTCALCWSTKQPINFLRH